MRDSWDRGLMPAGFDPDDIWENFYCDPKRKGIGTDLHIIDMQQQVLVPGMPGWKKIRF